MIRDLAALALGALIWAGAVALFAWTAWVGITAPSRHPNDPLFAMLVVAGTAMSCGWLFLHVIIALPVATILEILRHLRGENDRPQP